MKGGSAMSPETAGAPDLEVLVSLLLSGVTAQGCSVPLCRCEKSASVRFLVCGVRGISEAAV